jgi:DNA-binding CsgD family transcriptional regulator
MDPEVVIAALDCLTRREAEAVLWVAQGKTSWEAGRILGVTESTMNAHVANAAAKLQASNRPHLVARAFVRGILAIGNAALCLLLAVVCAFGASDPARVARRCMRSRSREDLACEAIARTPGGA